MREARPREKAHEPPARPRYEEHDVCVLGLPNKDGQEKKRRRRRRRVSVLGSHSIAAVMHARAFLVANGHCRPSELEHKYPPGGATASRP